MHFLESMLEHRTVLFLQEILVDVHAIVRVDSKEVGVVGRMVDLAHTQSVRNRWYASIVRIGENVGCIQQLRVSESADGAAVLICVENLAPELSLMNPLPDGPFYVFA